MKNSICEKTINGCKYPQIRRIVCAACLFTTESGEKLIITGARHFDSIMHHQIRAIKSSGAKITHSAKDQGFIDQFGDYHNRQDAWKIAANVGQIRNIISDNKGVLFSEHLY